MSNPKHKAAAGNPLAAVTDGLADWLAARTTPPSTNAHVDLGERVMLDAALALAARGFPVFPIYEPRRTDAGVACSCPKGAECGPSTAKHPRIPDNLRQATTESATIRGWWTQWPAANIGIATGGPARLVVLDVDGKTGGVSLARLEAEHGPIGVTLTAHTGRDDGGAHLYFRCPNHYDLDAIRSRSSHVAPKLDQKGTGGYVVAPPSRHLSGRDYVYQDSGVPVCELPGWLYERMIRERRTELGQEQDAAHGRASVGETTVGPERRPEQFARAVAWLEKCAPSIQGESGSSRLAYAVCGVVRGFDLDDASAYRALTSGFNERCVPPWSERELRHAIGNMRVNGHRFSIGELIEPEQPLAQSRADLDGESAALERGDHVELANHLLRRIAPKDEMLVFDAGAMHRYSPRSGLWEPVDDSEMSRIVQSLAGTPYGPKGIPVKLRYTDVTGTIQCARDQRKRRGFFADAPPGIAFANGFAHVRQDGIDLRPHSPHWRARAGYPFELDAHARAPRWEAFLVDLFRDDVDRNEKIAFLLMFIGACLIGLAPRYQRCAVLVGDGNNGKSTLLEIVGAMMPDGSCCAIPPQQWDDKYMLAELAGRRLNAVSELPEADILDSGTFKAIVTGDAKLVRGIYKAPFELRPIAGHLFATNALPGVVDMTIGFWRRFIVLRLSRSFSPQETQPNIAQEIIAAERPGIVAWMLEAARALLAAGQYIIPSSAERELAEWRTDADSVALYVQEETRAIRDGEAWSRARELYQSYRHWCEDNGFRAVSSKKFAARMLALHKGKRHTRDGSQYPVIRVHAQGTVPLLR